MTTLRLLGEVMLLASFAPLAFAQSAPTGFRNLTWGAMPKDVLREFPRATCRGFTARKGVQWDWFCKAGSLHSDQVLVHGVRVELSVGGYSRGRVKGMTVFWLTFAPSNAASIIEAFEEQYGKRERADSGGERWTWEFPTVTILLDEDMKVMNRGSVEVHLKAAKAREAPRSAERKRKGGL